MIKNIRLTEYDNMTQQSFADEVLHLSKTRLSDIENNRKLVSISKAIEFANKCSSQVVQKKGTAKININELEKNKFSFQNQFINGYFYFGNTNNACENMNKYWKETQLK